MVWVIKFPPPINKKISGLTSFSGLGIFGLFHCSHCAELCADWFMITNEIDHTFWYTYWPFKYSLVIVPSFLFSKFLLFFYLSFIDFLGFLTIYNSYKNFFEYLEQLFSILGIFFAVSWWLILNDILIGNHMFYICLYV